ncbi:unnamed protein product [Blepharisma stoltei]|uniref:Major facilitator superfamily (MFS) profile domain-containing protein n=1 Tax=Blepharisma stoltei TaxID=1481888 RepID=A0AAU9JSN0_9CILI|nr:unnamed protein product [Blepharisma stoltei]
MFKIGIFPLIATVFFSYYSSIAALPIIEDSTDSPTRGVVTLAYVLGFLLAPYVADHLKHVRRRNYLISSVLLVIFGVAIYPIAAYLTPALCIIWLAISIVFISLGAVGFYVPALTLLLAHDPKNIYLLFPVAEFSWDLGYTFGLTMPLYLSEKEHFLFYFLSCTLLLALVFIFTLKYVKKTPREDDENLDLEIKDLIKENEILLDCMVIIFVVAAARCIDPVLDGILEDSDRDDGTITIFIVGSSIVSFVVTGIFCLFLEKIDRKVIMLLGIIGAIIGLILIGIVNTIIGEYNPCLLYGLIFLDFGMSVGTASGFPIITGTAMNKIGLKLTDRVVDLIAGIYVTAIMLGAALGPAMMIWLTYYMEYYHAAIIWFGLGIIVAIIYIRHTWHGFVTLPRKQKELEKEKLIKEEIQSDNN